MLLIKWRVCPIPGIVAASISVEGIVAGLLQYPGRFQPLFNIPTGFFELFRRQTPLTPVLYRTTVENWKALENSDREERLDRSGWHTPSDSETDRLFLSDTEIREMADSGIDFGSHTINHAILPRLSSREMEFELRESKLTLEKILGSPIDQLAYPNGDWSDEVVRLARSCGYRVGCTTRSMRVSALDNHLLLPRVEPEWDFMDRTTAVFNEAMFEWRAR